MPRVISAVSAACGPRISLRANFVATFVGNALFAASQWAVLSLIAKLGNNEMLGQYALALAVVTPVVQFSHLNLRAVLATDIGERHPFGDYLVVRLGTTALGLAAVSALALASPYRWPVPMAVLILGFALSVDNLSDVYYGLLQRRERMDQIARSLVARGLLSVAALGVTLWFTRSLVAGVGTLAVARTAVLLVYDRPTASAGEPLRTSGLRAQAAVFCTSLPLGIALMLIALTNNLPRYAIAQKLGTAELGAFAAVASFMTVGQTVVNALGQAATPRLASYFSAGEMRRFRHLSWQLAGLVCLLGAAGIAAALVLGPPLLGLLYRPAYAAYAGLLTWMMAAAFLTYVASILGYVTITARVFTPQVPLLAAAAVSSAIASRTLVPRWGLNGGAAALAIVALVEIVGLLLLLRHVLSGWDTWDESKPILAQANPTGCLRMPPGQ
jgi:O-antigen/teichoic acid export membrane protein